MTGKLYVVATPIGNLKDITLRAIEILRTCDVIAAEDTRHSRQLLNHYQIKTRLTSYHDHTDSRDIERLMELLENGASVSLISDAGTPLISDPGYRLVAMARQKGVLVCPIPGVTALIAGLSVAGLPTDRFVFEGFLPAKEAARCRRLEALAAESRTLVFYESPHRLQVSLQAMIDIFGQTRRVFLVRELTKRYENHFYGEVASALNWVDENNSRGEFVIIVEGRKQEVSLTSLEEKALETVLILQEDLPLKRAVVVAARINGVRKNSLYKLYLSKQNSSTQ
jgi:16S rRNA (cytidine1402-2'-O)-methyltransferase